jgi:hypothetical protein
MLSKMSTSHTLGKNAKLNNQQVEARKKRNLRVVLALQPVAKKNSIKKESN